MTRTLGTSTADILAAAALLQAGGLVALPTETVYGLGADATNDRAVAGIFAAKGRPQFNPLIVHVPDLDAAAEYADVTQIARVLAAAFWPGPLTLVMPVRDGTLSPLVTAGLPTVAIRVPAGAAAHCANLAAPLRRHRPTHPAGSAQQQPPMYWTDWPVKSTR
jgi:L-threonylcarbamoyladenylate synthase